LNGDKNVYRATKKRRRWPKWLGLAAGVAVVAVLALFLVSTFAHLRVPKPTGPFAVGKIRETWLDTSRSEWMTTATGDQREVIALIWYPAVEGTGQKPSYVGDLGTLGPQLVASTKLSKAEVWGLRFVRDNARWEADVAPADKPYPVVVLSPGNGGNAEFYASYAEDLASHGYVVVGLDHPYDVAAVALSDGSFAVFDPNQWPAENPARQQFFVRRMKERATDVSFALDCLARMNITSGPLKGKLDLERTGIMGHSMGGITGAAACRQDARLKACLNIDGSLGGGPFSARPGDVRPQQPFMYITKDQVLPATYAARFEAPGGDSFRIVVADATHIEFADGPLFVPSLDPFARHADRVIATTRAYTLAFFDRYLKGTAEPGFPRIQVPLKTQVQVFGS
jgi:predicted dienelactone hydrolase